MDRNLDEIKKSATEMIATLRGTMGKLGEMMPKTTPVNTTINGCQAKVFLSVGGMVMVEFGSVKDAEKYIDSLKQ